MLIKENMDSVINQYELVIEDINSEKKGLVEEISFLNDKIYKILKKNDIYDTDNNRNMNKLNHFLTDITKLEYT